MPVAKESGEIESFFCMLGLGVSGFLGTPSFSETKCWHCW